MYSNIHSIFIHAARITFRVRHSPKKVDLFQMSLSSGIISRFLSTSPILLRGPKKKGITKKISDRVALGRVVLYNKRHLPVHKKMLFK